MHSTFVLFRDDPFSKRKQNCFDRLIFLLTLRRMDTLSEKTTFKMLSPSEMGLLYKEKNAPRGSKFFPYRV